MITRTAFFLLSLSLIVFTIDISAQNDPMAVAGLSIPAELKGAPKLSEEPSASDKAFLDVLDRAGKNGFERSSLPALDKFIQDHPSYGEAYYWRAQAEICGKEWSNLARGEADLDLALEHKGEKVSSFKESEALALKARIELADGHKAAALNVLEKAMRLDLQNAYMLFNAQGTSPETTSDFCTWNLTDLGSLAASAPNDWRPLVLRGLYFQFFARVDEKFYPEAMAAYQKAAILNNRTAIAPYLLGVLRINYAFWSQRTSLSDSARDEISRTAIPLFSRSIALDPRFVSAYVSRAEAYLQLKQYTLAIKDFDSVLALDPESTTAFSDRGLARMDVGQYYPAISDFGDAIRSQEVTGSDYLESNYEQRADAYVKVRDDRSAITDYSAAIKIRVENQIIVWSLKQFRSLYPEFSAIPDDELLHKLHQRYYPQWDYANFKKQIEKNGEWRVTLLSTLYEKRADAFLRTGDYRRGITDYQRIYAAMPINANFMERWRFLGLLGGGDKYYLDAKASDVTSGQFPRIWVKKVGARQKEVTAFVLDCTGRKLRVASNVIYDNGDETLGSSNDGGSWNEIIPDTLGEQLWNGACESNP